MERKVLESMYSDSSEICASCKTAREELHALPPCCERRPCSLSVFDVLDWGGVQSIDDTVDIDDDILTELAYQMIRQGDVALTFKGHRYYLHAPGVYNRPNRILSGDDLNPCRLLGETGCILSVGERYSGGLLFRAAKDHMNCCWPKIDGLDEAFWHNRQHLLESVARRVETNNQD